MTVPNGITSEGYRHGLLRLEVNCIFFSKQLCVDNSFLTKYGNFIDSVQQVFFTKLSKFGSIAAAAPTLQDRMRTEVDDGIRGIVIASAVLPGLLFANRTSQ